MSYSLAIDSSSTKLQYCLWNKKEQSIIKNYSFLSDKHILKLPELIEYFKKQGVKIEEIEDVFIGIGPGNFSSIRIGVSFLKGLFFKQELYGVPSSLALVRSFQHDSIVLCPAGRELCFVSKFLCQEGKLIKNEHGLIDRKSIVKLPAENLLSYDQGILDDFPLVSRVEMDLSFWRKIDKKDFLFSNEILYLRSAV